MLRLATVLLLTSLTQAQVTAKAIDVNKHWSSSKPRFLTAVGDSLFFVANPGSGEQLYRHNPKDGLKRIELNKTALPMPVNLASIQGQLYLSAKITGSAAYKLLRIKADDTYEVLQNASGHPAGGANLTLIGSTIYFSGYDPVHGSELWTLDPRTTTPKFVADTKPGRQSSSPGHFTLMGGEVYLSARFGTGTSSWTLGKLDNTGKPVQLTDSVTKEVAYKPESLTAIGNRLFFRRQIHSTKYYLADWSNGRLTNHTAADGARELVEVSGKLYYVAYFGVRIGFELGTWDGKQAVPIDLRPGKDGSYPRTLTRVGSRLFLAASTGHWNLHVYDPATQKAN